MDLLLSFAQALNTLFSGFLDLLPPSPFIAYFEQLKVIEQWLGYLNWVIPFDICTDILNVWLSCCLAYILFNFARGTLSSKNEILNRVLNFLF